MKIAQQSIRILAILLFGVFAVRAVRAQVAGSGEIRGTISDPTGAVVPGASVVAVNVATGVKTSTLTTGAGFYVVSPLAPGDYTVTVRAKGFQTLEQQNVIVNALTVMGLNLVLKVGATTQMVTVTAAPPALDTTNGTLGITISNEEYSALPVAMSGGPMAADGFITLLPGVQSFPLAGGGFNINGGIAGSNSIYINGLPNTQDSMTGSDQMLNTGFPIQAIDQFQIDTNGTPAMYQGQGVENFLLKSGTNQMHGQLYEYIRNTVFDAAGFFNSTTPIEKQNEFGGAVGGPILKNRLFYFGNYDGYRYRAVASYAYNTLPTTEEQAGNFSALPVAIYDPETVSCNSQGACTAQQFSYSGVLNVIPPDRISPISKYLQSFLPPPVNSSLENNYLGGLFPGTNQSRYLAKVDAVITQKDHLYGFANWGNYSNPTLPPGGTNLPLPYASSRYTVLNTDVSGLGYTHVVSPHLMNALNAEYNRWISGTSDPTNNENWAANAGLTGLPAGYSSQTFPPIDFGGPDSPTDWDINGDTEPYQWTANDIGLGDTLEWTHGRQDINIGFQISIERAIQEALSEVSDFSFSNDQTAGYLSTGSFNPDSGNAYASFLLGNVESAALTQDAIAETGFSNNAISFFVQDNMKVMPRLTLNLGLRYDIYTPDVESHNIESWLDPNEPNPEIGGYYGALEFAGYGTDSCDCRSPIPTWFKNIGPRFGFAYALNQKTVVRGGYGIFYPQAGAFGGNQETEGLDQLGYTAAAAFTAPSDSTTAAFNWNSGFPAYTHAPSISPTLNTGDNTNTTSEGGPIDSFGYYQYAKRLPYMQNWDFTIERQIDGYTPIFPLLRGLILNVSYSGSTSHFLPTDAGWGIFGNQILPSDLALGNLLTSNANATTIAEAQAIIPGVQLPYANFSGTIGQMLLPFPQYAGGVNDIYPMSGTGSYNSLQVAAQKKYSDGLMFLVSYTYGKEIDDAGSINQLAAPSLVVGRTTYNAHLERSVGFQNIPNTFVASYVYDLPFGAGHLGGGNAFIRSVVSHWRLSGIETYEQGEPLGPFTGSCDAPYTGSCYADYNPSFSGSVRINGRYGAGYYKGSDIPYINVNAFENPAAFALGNTPRTQPYGLRNPPYFDDDFALQRSFPIRENMKLAFEASAFNAFNRTQLGSINTDISDAAFGQVASQITSPRKLQFDATLSF